MAYTKEKKKTIVQAILNEVMDGMAVRNAIKVHNISQTTFYNWLREDEAKLEQYARATEIRADVMATEILTICDATKNDIIVDENGNPITNHNVIQRDRLRVDTRKWLMSKMQPKKYGDKAQLDHTTGGEKLINKMEVIFKDFSEDAE